jgi:hypothetical protein
MQSHTGLAFFPCSFRYPSKRLPLTRRFRVLPFVTVKLSCRRVHHPSALNSGRTDLSNFDFRLVGEPICVGSCICPQAHCVFTNTTHPPRSAENIALLLQFREIETACVLLCIWQYCFNIQSVSITSNNLARTTIRDFQRVGKTSDLKTSGSSANLARNVSSVIVEGGESIKPRR